MIEYWKNAAEHTYTSFRGALIDFTIALMAVPVSYGISLAGHEEAFSRSSLYGIAAVLAVLIILFIVRLFLLTPPKLDAFSREREETLRREVLDLGRRLDELQIPRLQFVVRQGDNRYIRRTETVQRGYVSVTNPPNQVRSVEDVTVVLSAIIGGGQNLRHLSDVWLRIDDRYPALPITIHPGQTKFIPIVSYNVPEGGDPVLTVPHGGTDGHSGMMVPIPQGSHYTAKIHINARDMPLLSTTVRFEVKDGELVLEQVS